MLGAPVRVTVNMSQSVPSTQVVSSVVAPAIPPPDQVVDEPLAGVKVPEGGVEAMAGKPSAKDRARKNVILSLKFEGSFKLQGTALLENSAEIVGHKTASSFRFFAARKHALSFALLKQAPKAMYHRLLCE